MYSDPDGEWPRRDRRRDEPSSATTVNGMDTEQRELALDRDRHRCTWTQNHKRIECLRTATHVDYIGNEDDDSLENLRSLCEEHHESFLIYRDRARSREARPKKKHPGLL